MARGLLALYSLHEESAPRGHGPGGRLSEDLVWVCDLECAYDWGLGKAPC